MAQQPVKVRQVVITDRAEWDVLYQDYAEFYKVNQTAAMRDAVWSWLIDEAVEVYGLVAEDADQKLIGITHFRPYKRPLSASTGGFLDDLFVDPTARGTGAAAALIDGVKHEGIRRGWTVVRWITAEDNYRARGLYDQMAERTKWVTYDIKL